VSEVQEGWEMPACDAAPISASPTSSTIGVRITVFGWFTKWRESVDFGLRPRHVHEGAEINLYPFTKQTSGPMAGAKFGQVQRVYMVAARKMFGAIGT
jgi:hypothetical protein